MGAFTLQLFEDHLRAAARRELPAATRVIYVLSCDIVVTTDGLSRAVSANRAWRGGSSCGLTTGLSGATTLGWELIRGTRPTTKTPIGTNRWVLAHPMTLDD